VTQEHNREWKTERGYDKPLDWTEKEQGTKGHQHVFLGSFGSRFALNFGRESENLVEGRRVRISGDGARCAETIDIGH